MAVMTIAEKGELLCACAHVENSSLKDRKKRKSPKLGIALCWSRSEALAELWTTCSCKLFTSVLFREKESCKNWFK